MSDNGYPRLILQRAGQPDLILVQVVAVVEDRHPIHGEPTRLRVVGMNEGVDLRDENQFVIFWGDETSFGMTAGEPPPSDPSDQT